MSTQLQEAPPQRGFLRAANVFKLLVVGVLGGLLTMVATWDTADALQRRICKEWDRTREIVQRIDGLCMPKYRVVTLPEARALVDLFLLRAGSGDPDEAVPLFVPASMDSAGRDEFIADWTPVSFAERTADLQASTERFNTFEVTWRRFKAPPREDESSLPNWWAERQTVDDLRFNVTLERTDSGDVGVAAVTPEHKVGPINETRGLARVSFTKDTKGKRWPGSTETTGATRVGEGSTERVLCAQQTPDQMWWFNTYIGWFSGDEISLVNEPPEEWLYCSNFIDYQAVSTLDDKLP